MPFFYLPYNEVNKYPHIILWISIKRNFSRILVQDNSITMPVPSKIHVKLDLHFFKKALYEPVPQGAPRIRDI